MATNLNPLTDLDALLQQFSDADRGAARDLLTRNAAAAQALVARETVYNAFVDGDQQRLEQVTRLQQPAQPQQVPTMTQPQQPAQQQPAQQPQQSLTADLSQLDTLLSQRLSAIYSSPEFTAAVEARAKAIADSQLAAATPTLIGRGAEIADTIASIREQHRAEFNEPLDSTQFKEFFQKEGAAYGNDLTRAYAGFVGEKRVQKKIADGIAAGLAARETSNVPGTTLPTANNERAPNFIEYNMKTIGQTAVPAEDVDKMAQSFRAMQTQWKQ